jgi:hypothetical protein
MLTVFRPSSDVVREGRILKKIKHLQTQIVGVFLLVPVWCLDLEFFNEKWTSFRVSIPVIINT